MNTQLQTEKLVYLADMPLFYGFYDSIHLSETDLQRDLQNISYSKLNSIDVQEFIASYSQLWNKFKADNKAKSKRNYKKEFIEKYVIENDPCLYNGLSWKEAKDQVAIKYIEFFKSHLDLALFGIKDLTLRSIFSPNQYNYITDSIEVYIQFFDKEIFKEKIKELIFENTEIFNELVDLKFTSCDGFNSFYSNDPDDWKSFKFENLTTKAHDFDNIMLKFYLHFMILVATKDTYLDSDYDSNSEISIRERNNLLANYLNLNLYQ